MAANDTTVLVPSANVDGVGLRRAIDDAEVDRLFKLLGDGKIDSQQNWKGRFKDNSEKMRTGSIYDVADVLKSLTLLSKSKSLSFREKRMLDRARFLIITEVAEVTSATSRRRSRGFSTRRCPSASRPAAAISRKAKAVKAPSSWQWRSAPRRPNFAGPVKRRRARPGMAGPGLFLRRACLFAWRCKSSPNLMEVKGSEPQGRRREVGSEGSGEQTREPMDKNRIRGVSGGRAGK
ncbi:MAG: hypothetical protein MZV64_15330 [Ignavibacteriales bacterium]|nr:hypothetical protein [Ignavibacteriales bacterium]